MSRQKIEEMYKLAAGLLESVEADEFVKEDTLSLDMIKHTMEQLKERRFVVSVIAAMKAGKSTTFNALLGRDLLPNENKSCTAAVTEIKHSPEAADIVQKVYKDGRITQIAASSAYTLEEAFHQDVRKSRDTDEVKDIAKYYVETPIAAVESSEYKGLVQNFILVDTPGPDEADTGKFDVAELQKAALEHLRHSDALIMLFDYQRYKSDTNARILKSIFENREDIVQDQGKIFFLVNKIDEMTAKDGTVEDVIEDVKQLIREHAPFIEEPQVMAFSAKQAVLARSFLHGTATEYTLSELKKYEGKYEKTEIIEGRKYRMIPEPEEYAAEVLEESRILDVESALISRMFSQASGKMLDNSAERIGRVLMNIEHAANGQLEVSTKSESELTSEVQASKIEIEKLHKETSELKQFTKSNLSKLKKDTAEILEQAAEEIKESLGAILPDVYHLESSNKNELEARIQGIRQNVQDTVLFEMNKRQDMVQRMMTAAQVNINKGLNERFSELAVKASELIGERMILQLQVLTLDDLELEAVEFTGEDLILTGTSGADPAGTILKKTLAGAGSGLGAGIILPGIGNIAGAVVGGIVGLIGGLASKDAEQTRYMADFEKMKEELMEKAQEAIASYSKEIDAKIEGINKNYGGYLEEQMDSMIRHLKKQLDSLLEEFVKNKYQLDSHIEHMNTILEWTNWYQSRLQALHSIGKPVNIG